MGVEGVMSKERGEEARALSGEGGRNSGKGSKRSRKGLGENTQIKVTIFLKGGWHRMCNLFWMFHQFPTERREREREIRNVTSDVNVLYFIS